MSYYIGSDIGTTGTKTIVIDEKGKLLGRSTVEHPLSTPKPGWAEQESAVLVSPEATVTPRRTK